MNKLFVNLTIVNYSDNGYLRCELRTIIDGGDVITYKLEPSAAMELMWELKRLGGKKQMYVNQYNPYINYREVDLWLKK